MPESKKQGLNLWFGLIIIGPAILFLGLLWNGWDKNSAEQIVTYNLPEQIVSSGSVFGDPQEKYNFFPAILTDEFKTPGSINLAGAGSAYLFLPALLPDASDPSLSVYVLDNQGMRSDPFRTYRSNEFTLPQKLPTIEIPSGEKLVYVLFKVSNSASQFYLVGKIQDKEAAWPLPLNF